MHCGIHTGQSGITYVPVATAQTGNKMERLIMLLQSAIRAAGGCVLARPITRSCLALRTAKASEPEIEEY
jgi:hypothetical protein